MRKPHFFGSAPTAILPAVAFARRTAVLSVGLFACSVAVWGQAQQTTGSASGSGPGIAGAGGVSAANIGGITDDPISPGEVVRINVFGAPGFSIVTRVSESGDIAYPMIGVIHLAGQTSATAADLISTQLKTRGLLQEPDVIVTVDSTSTGITVMGEVRSPGIYSPPGKHLLSDLLAAAGGLTSNVGRVIELSNEKTPDKKTDILWDPTMHNTDNYNTPVHPGDRVLVRACGFAYIGGNVEKPGAYALCGSKTVTFSELVAMAGGDTRFIQVDHTLLIRQQPDGTRMVQDINIKKVQRAEAADPVVREDDIVYVTPSTIKTAINDAFGFARSIAAPLIYVGTR